MRFNLENSKVTNPESAAKFNESVSKLEAMRAVIEEQKKKLQEQFKTEFDLIVKDFFQAVPVIKSLTWTQYTPYFNDGDACYFSVNDIYFASDENEDCESYREVEEEDVFSDGLYSLKHSNILTKEQIAICEQMEALISGNEDIMEEIFGDHTLVVLRESGSETQEYDHD
jgi:hypothetical protein